MKKYRWNVKKCIMNIGLIAVGICIVYVGLCYADILAHNLSGGSHTSWNLLIR